MRRAAHVGARPWSRSVAILLLVVTGCSVGGAGQAGAPGSSSPQASQGAGSGDPLVLTSTAESELAAEGTVTFLAGGTVSATASDGTTFELLVPPEAVAEDTVIRMTPLRDVKGLGTDGPIYAVQLEPDGQVFHEHVRLTITPASPIPIEQQLVFDANEDGTDAGPVEVDHESEAVVALLEHFTKVGLGQFTDAQKATMLRKSAENAEKRLAREMAERTQAERERQFRDRSDGTDPEYEELLDKNEETLDEYEREVVEKRREAAMISCEGLALYVKTVIGIERARTFMVTGRHDDSQTTPRVARALAEMTARFKECEKEAIKRCQEAKKPAILLDFWLAMSKQFGTDEGDPAARKARAERICRPGFTLIFTRSDIPFTNDNTEDISGRVQGCPTPDGGWSFTGSAVSQTDWGTEDYPGSPSGLDEPFEELLLDMTGGQTPDRFTLVLSDEPTPEAHRQAYTRLGIPDDTVTFVDALGSPAGSVVLHDGFGEPIGEFVLEVATADPECPTPPR